MWEMILKDLTIVSWVGIAGLFSVFNIIFSVSIMLSPFVALELLCYWFYARKAQRTPITMATEPARVVYAEIVDEDDSEHRKAD